MIRPALPHDGPRVEKAIRELCRLGNEWWSEPEIRRDLATGARVLWLVGDRAFAMTRICGRALFVDALIGKGFAEWGADFDAAMRAEAKRLGLKEVAARCRKGFAPFGREHGWRETHREYRVEVG